MRAHKIIGPATIRSENIVVVTWSCTCGTLGNQRTTIMKNTQNGLRRAEKKTMAAARRRWRSHVRYDRRRTPSR